MLAEPREAIVNKSVKCFFSARCAINELYRPIKLVLSISETFRAIKLIPKNKDNCVVLVHFYALFKSLWLIIFLKILCLKCYTYIQAEEFQLFIILQ